MEQKTFDRMLIMESTYQERGIEAISQKVEEGRALIEKHGTERLFEKLEGEEFATASAFFLYNVAMGESNYEDLESEDEDPENE